MSFELPSPKTRKEYYMAIAAGGEPGVDFPERVEVPSKTIHNDDLYEVVLESVTAGTGYKYAKAISGFTVVPGPDLVIKINGKATTNSGNKYVNEDGYTMDPGRGLVPSWTVYIESETELSGSALNVTVEAIYDAIIPAIPLQPKTVEEAYYANLARIDVASALSAMSAKTRKDQYLNAIINVIDDGGGK